MQNFLKNPLEMMGYSKGFVKKINEAFAEKMLDCDNAKLKFN